MVEFLRKTFSYISGMYLWKCMLTKTEIQNHTKPTEGSESQGQGELYFCSLSTSSRYWEIQSAREMVHPKVILKSQIAKVISPSTQSNSEDLSIAEDIHTICTLTSSVLSPKCRLVIPTFDVQTFLTIKEFLLQDIKKRMYCLLYGHCISVSVPTVNRLSFPPLEFCFITD